MPFTSATWTAKSSSWRAICDPRVLAEYCGTIIGTLTLPHISALMRLLIGTLARMSMLPFSVVFLWTEPYDWKLSE